MREVCGSGDLGADKVRKSTGGSGTTWRESRRKSEGRYCMCIYMVRNEILGVRTGDVQSFVCGRGWGGGQSSGCGGIQRGQRARRLVFIS